MHRRVGTQVAWEGGIYAQRSLPTMGERLGYAQKPLPTLGERLGYAQQMSFHHEEGLVYARHTCHTHGRRAWSMRNRVSHPWEEGLVYAHHGCLTPMGRGPGLCATCLSHPREEGLVYAQRPLSFLRVGWSMRRGPSPS